ncbi:DMT family transporter [Anaeroselena agilis]|uniref:DMT family transporter n=1 Tax=Anaeroselena agilis TaxID=3063788 RepID=A0ABU3P1E2_9FIRM|nr:DMT family transporter [Selenomonadales bacterium 4137-cl]
MNWLLGSGRTEHFRAIILLVITAVLWSSSGLLIKAVDWHPLAISGVRSLVAAAVIRFAFRRQPLNLSKVQITGALGYAAMVTLFVSANKMTTAANAIVLQYTAPIWVALFGAWFLKEKATILDWATIGLVFGGMTLFFQDQMEAGHLLGNLLAVGSGISLAVMALAMRSQKDASPFGSVLLGNTLAFLFGIPFLFHGNPGLGGLSAIVFLGIFQLGFSYVLYSLAIKHVTAIEATIITMIEPVLNPIWVFFLLGEAPGPWSLTGGAVILAAIVARYVFPAMKSSAKIQGAR